MTKQTVQGLILQKLEDLNTKVDLINTSTVPKLMVDIAVGNQKIKDEAKLTSKIHAMVWGGLTLTVSLAGLAVAYFRK